ncbi:MAG: peptidylprolyl isomerase [Herbaspirillum sp.]|nr:peptidylprolyl isomerase [Herbaspirillum sp.]
MFDFIRNHQRLMQFLLLLFIFPSFAFFGLQSYTRMSDSDSAVAKVAGESITQQDWDNATRQQMDRMRQMFGDQFDAKLLDTPEAKRAVLDNLIAQRAMVAEVNRDKLQVSDQAIAQALMAIPGLIKPDGTFDNDQYKTLLGAQGMTPALYEARLRQDLALQQLNTAVQASAFAPKTVSGRLSDLNDQERTVQQLTFTESTYAAQVKVTDDMLKTYYDKHPAQFQVPEQARIEYLVLDNAAVGAQINVSDDDIKSYYEQNKQQYGSAEERRASHILIAVKKDASAADKAAAKAKADKLYAQLSASPGDFAKLAKANSNDPGSAEHGGDLGYFARGMMVKQFEDAAFQMKEGQIGQPVQSDFGYHIIQLTGIKPATVKTLEQVKPEIAAAIRTQLLTKKFAELADVFNNTVYEQGDSLQPAADKLKLKIQTASNVTRLPNPTLSPAAPYNNAKFLTALFADDVIKNKHNTEAIEVAPNTLVAGRVVEYKPQSKQPFEAVRAAVRERVIQEQETMLAKQAGEAKLAALKQKDDSTGFGDQKSVSRVKNQGFDADTVTALMKTDTAKLPAYVGVAEPGSYSVFRISKVGQPEKPDAARRQAEQQQVSDALAQQEMLSYMNALKDKAKVKLLKAAFKPPVTPAE